MDCTYYYTTATGLATSRNNFNISQYFVAIYNVQICCATRVCVCVVLGGGGVAVYSFFCLYAEAIILVK